MTTHTSWTELRDRRMQEPGATQAYDATRQAFSTDVPPQNTEASPAEPDDQAPPAGRRTN
jgi:hypothetical protein